MPRVFNKGKRTFTYSEAIADDDGRLLPEQQKSLTALQAETLKRLYPNEIVNLDDSADLQGQFGAVGGVPTISVEQAEAEKKAAVEAAVAAALAGGTGSNGSAAQGGAPGPVTGGTGNAETITPVTEEEKAALITKLEGMDRAAIIAFIEENDLAVDHGRLKSPDSLKKGVLTAIEAKGAVAAAA